MKPHFDKLAAQKEAKATQQKAFAINLDRKVYGTLAEIGAGQEVARAFFRAGGASGTIAKTISAYDMQVSDAIYGSSSRYVSRRRLLTMLDHEYDLLIQRLDKKRGADTRFFAFADTVTAKSYSRKGESHGWMGIRFQAQPRVDPSEIIMHLRMLDAENVQQQETLGTVGVNLICGAIHHWNNPDKLIRSLLDNLTRKRVEVDTVKCSGPAFVEVDNRLTALKLVEFGLSDAAMFTADNEVVQPSEVLYKKPILVERGSFRPFTKLNLDMLECAEAQFVQEPQVQDQAPVILLEITMRQLTEERGVDPQDFLDRVDILRSLGQTVLISNYGEYFRLASYLFRYTDQMIGIALGVPNLKELFEEKYYTDLAGGILESFGRMFKNDLKVYVYPFQHRESHAIISAENLQVAPHLRHLYAHLLENQRIECLRGYHREFLPIYSREVLAKIKQGNPTWENDVPSSVAEMIKQRSLFDCCVSQKA